MLFVLLCCLFILFVLLFCVSFSLFVFWVTLYVFGLFSSFFCSCFRSFFCAGLESFLGCFVGISWQLVLSLIYSLAPAYLYPSRFAVRLQPSWVLWECVRSSESSCLLCWSCQDVLVQKSWRDIWRLGPHGSAGHL